MISKCINSTQPSWHDLLGLSQIFVQRHLALIRSSDIVLHGYINKVLLIYQKYVVWVKHFGRDHSLEILNNK